MRRQAIGGALALLLAGCAGGGSTGSQPSGATDPAADSHGATDGAAGPAAEPDATTDPGVPEAEDVPAPGTDPADPETLPLEPDTGPQDVEELGETTLEPEPCPGPPDPCACGPAEPCDEPGTFECVQAGSSLRECVAHVNGCTTWTLPLPCDDGLECTGVEHCIPDLGCLHNEAPAGCCETDADCGDDGDACNGTALCVAGPEGQCVFTVAPECEDDGNPCNGSESCDPNQGCIGLDRPEEGCCLEDPDCEDGDPCNGLFGCVEESCALLAAPPICEDGDPCNGVHACEPGVGCVLAAASECDDGDPCNGLETCDSGSGCAAGSPVDCGDGDPCTTDLCVATGESWSCASTPDPACTSDEDRCNGIEFCDPDVGCDVTPPLQCVDGIVCNGDESCDPIEGCVAGPAPPGCCATSPICEDGNLCNGLSQCNAATGTCETTPHNNCLEDNVCDGLSVCDPDSGCYQALPAPDCDDEDPCTKDACHPLAGCVHEGEDIEECQ